MYNPSGPRLLGDIGGTNARFSFESHAGGPIVDVATLDCAEHDSLQSAIHGYLAAHGRQAPLSGAIAIANPIVGDHVQMANHHWSFSISGLQRDLGLERLEVINDFTALALSLPVIPPAELRQIGRGTAIAGAPLAVLGPGTGLGARGGVFIGGGIAPQLVEEIERSSFRERFEGKGRFRDYLGGIPTFVINASVSPALAGAARALDMDA